MKRRDAVLAPFALGAATLAWTQIPGRIYRVGYPGFTATNSPNDLRVWNGFVQRLRELGFNQGSNLVIEDRYAEGRMERYPELAAEIVKIKAASPSATRIAYAWCPRCSQDSGYSAAEIAAILAERSAVARSLGMTMLPLDVNAASHFDATSAALLRQRAEALLIGSTPVNAALREKWHTFTNQNRLPTMAESRGNGSMFSCGADPAAIFVRAAELVAKSLSCTAPGEMPMEQPTRFTFAIDLKLAKAMGITIPQSVLLRADEVIQ